MISGFLEKFRWGKWGLLAAAGLLLGFAFLLNRWQNQIEAAKARALKEYRIDFDISRRKAEHLSVYQSFVGDFKMPEAKTLRQNEWLQLAQSMAQEQSLSLRELKPVYSVGKRGVKTPEMFLVLEGSVPALLRFLYRIAEADHAVYVDKLLISLTTEQSENIRAQMTLVQAGRQGSA